ncbi:restriction endonuclease subunit S [Enterovibrio norvegicus]|uniref:restriction endonuclease subunit S n=1 Tax=Enterovibrio norvegicus TaxID=188144 RepID=UPI0010BEA068|nr:restriction endonuclease subunit S [Enterovibrio norvegicus]TKF29317.1 restriction endonuclease subunit S [Enterovibrio norvegicus]
MVPNGWERTRLKNIAKIKSGSTPLRAKQDLYYSQDGTPWVKTLDLNNSKIITTDERITELALKESSCSIFPINTVLVAMYGGFNQIGRTGLLTVPSAINQALSGLTLDETKANAEFILNYLNGNVRQWKKFAASSRKDPNITREDVCGFEVVLPPLPEQRKIAKILSTWDKAITTTEKLIATSKQQKKSLMQQLLTGKKRLVNPETGKVFEGEWEEFRVKDLVHSLDAGVSVNSDDDGDLSCDYKILKTSCVSSGIFRSSHTKSVKDTVEISRLKEPVLSDSIVISRMNTPFLVGANAYIEIAPANTFLPDRLWQVKPKMGLVYTRWLAYWFGSDHIRHSIRANATGTSGSMKNITKTDVFAIKVEKPTYEEQQKIASVLTAADTEIELLEAKLVHLKQEKKALMQQLLTGKRRVKVDEAEAELVTA